MLFDDAQREERLSELLVQYDLQLAAYGASPGRLMGAIWPRPVVIRRSRCGTSIMKTDGHL